MGSMWNPGFGLCSALPRRGSRIILIGGTVIHGFWQYFKSVQIDHGKRIILCLFDHALLTNCLHLADFIGLIYLLEGPLDARISLLNDLSNHN